MYDQLRGRLLELSPTCAVLEVGGIGFDLRIPLSTFEKLKGLKEVSAYTHLHVREDDLRLFGFASRAERDLFRLCLSVTGVGPSIALAALSAMAPARLVKALAEGDAAQLQEIKGVGRKLAERLALELRDRVGALAVACGAEGSLSREATEVVRRPEVADTIAALITLGFERKTATERARLAALEQLKTSADGALDVEKLIKTCLRRA